MGDAALEVRGLAQYDNLDCHRGRVGGGLSRVRAVISSERRPHTVRSILLPIALLRRGAGPHRGREAPERPFVSPYFYAG